MRCDEFDSFKEEVEEALKVIERIWMFLEDDREEKTAKMMQGLLKSANDNPIQSGIPKRLENQIEYTALIDKIRKDILVFSKF